MIEITNQTQEDYPNSFAKAEKEKPKVTRKSLNEGRVGNYLVRFTKFGRRIFADCVSVLTGETCLGHRHKGCCYHMASALLHVRQVENRKAA